MQQHIDKPASTGFKVNVDGQIIEFQNWDPTREEILEKVNKLPVGCYSLYQKLEGYDFELVMPKQKIDLRNLGVERLTVKDPVAFNYEFNGQPETSESKELSPEEILQAGGADPLKEYLIQVIDNGPDLVFAFNPTARIKMQCKGMKFITGTWLDEVNLEEYGKHCKEVPPAHRYRIKIHDQYQVLISPYTTGKDLIILSGKPNYKEYEIYAVYSNSSVPRKVGYDEDVDLTKQCLIRFVRQPKEQTEGRGSRQQFVLPEGEAELLDNRGFDWETLIYGNQRWVLIYDYPVPPGYNVTSATVALKIDAGYPGAQIDMASFHPHLTRTDGKVIAAVTPLSLDGKSFQQWSRHRKAGEWQPGIDNITTHLLLVDNWLTKYSPVCHE